MESKPKILVVDDEVQNLLLIETALAHMNYTVILAKDGVEAIEKVRNNPPDVILLDIMMPRMNGLEVTRELKKSEETKIIPIVILSGLKDVEDRIKYLEAGADDFLSKPIDIAELRTRVRTLLEVKAYYDHMRNDKKELENEVKIRTKQIKDASLETIYRLSRASEYRDEDTGEHIQRMSYYAAAVYRKMGMEEKDVEGILYASPMHDVGKIGIPDEILLKPGKLDSTEWEVMKKHTIIGGKILEGSQTEFVKLAEAIALTHHEKWDGSGYPNGLKNTEIPLSGRVTAIADVFDAVSSKRPYRKEPFSLEKSLEVINKGKGNHFDPDIVNTFLSIKNEIESIKEKYKDDGKSWLFRVTQE